MGHARRTGRLATGHHSNISIRIGPEAYRQAKIAAVTEGVTIGQWLEKAINEKLQKQEKQGNVTKKHR